MSPDLSCAPVQVHAGFPEAMTLQACSSPPCNGVRGPPFADCRALSIPCGPTCSSGAGADATHWQRTDDDSPLKYCDLNSTQVCQDVMGRCMHAPSITLCMAVTC